ncbi:MAG: alanine racemase [Clostridiales bacterium]|nr:alanine racemase [Clostridiales bacterium]
MLKKEILQQCAGQYETPFYLFDLDGFAERIRQIREVLGEQVNLCYAIKANPFLVGAASRCVERLEVCSPGEFAICEKNGISMEQIVLSGVYKEEKEIRRVLETYGGRGIYTVESQSQFELLEREAGKLGQRISVLLRLTSGNQFGMDEEQIRELVRNREQASHLHILGIQYYSGTQKKQKKAVDQELERLDALLLDLKEQYGFEAEELEYGPGFFVPYFQKEEKEELSETMKAFKARLEAMKFAGGITLEIGRYLAAECGTYVTRIVDVKKNGEQQYGIVDGGINHLNYFGQTMAMKIPYYQQMDGETMEIRERGEDDFPVTICGSLCTVSDVLVKNLPLGGKLLGDFLVFEKTGAYSVTEGIYLFLSRDLPLVLFWSEGEGLRLVRDRVHSSQWNSEKCSESHIQ